MKPIRLEHGNHSHEINIDRTKKAGLISGMRPKIAAAILLAVSACGPDPKPTTPGPKPIKFDPSVCLEVASVNAGQTKVIEIDSATGPDTDLLGNRVELNAGTLDKDATVCLQPATASNLPVPGEGTLKSAEGISVKFLEKDHEVDPDTGEENLLQPAGTYDLVLKGKRNTVVYHNPVSDTLDEESTEIELSGDTLESRATVSHASSFYPLNLDPKLSVVAEQTGPNEVTFDFSGTEDEGSAMPDGLTKEVEGLTLTPTADPDKFKATVSEGSQTFTASVKDPDNAVDAKNVGVEVLGIPGAPTITTNGGDNIGINEANFTLEGTAPTGAQFVEVSIDGGAFNTVTGSTNWSYSGAIINVGEFHTYTFRTKNVAGVSLGTDSILVERF